MIEELKRQLAELDRDLKPVLAHVEASQARREALVKALAAAEAVGKEMPKVEPVIPEVPKKPEQKKK